MFSPALISVERFVPHPYADLVKRRVYDPPLPESYYQSLIDQYEAMDDVAVSRIMYQSDGLAITGLMAIPAGATTGKHPLIVYNRGGHKEFGSLTVHSAMEHIVPFAKQGYLVFASNYRGNDGSEGTDEFGGGDVNDVLNLLEIASSHPGFDGKNRYMIGRSRGGMMTYLSIKQEASLNAAVSMAGISDLDGYRRLIPDTIDAEKLIESRSARRWPQQLTVPLLLLHGDNDNKVDVSHSVLLAQDLEQQSLTHKLKVYPGDNHALLRNAADTTEESIRWLEAFAQ